MHTTPLAAGELTGATGTVTGAAVSLVLVLVLVYGVIGKGKRKLASGPAQFVGLFCEIALLRTPQGTIWSDIGGAFKSIASGLAHNDALGAIGFTGLALVLIVLSLFARIVPASGTFLGLLLGASLISADGSIAQAVVQFVSIPLDMVSS